MSLLDDMGVWLQSGGIGTLAATSGTAIMLGGFSDLPDRQVTLIETPGLSALHTASGKLSRPRLRVAARDVDYVSAHGLCRQATDRLDEIVNRTVEGAYYPRVEAQLEPYDAGRDPSGRFIIVADFQVWTEWAAVVPDPDPDPNGGG